MSRIVPVVVSIAAVALLAPTASRAQSQPGASSPPSVGQRLDALRRNVFGAPAEPAAGTARTTNPSTSSAAGSSRMSAMQRGATAGAKMSGGSAPRPRPRPADDSPVGAQRRNPLAALFGPLDDEPAPPSGAESRSPSPPRVTASPRTAAAAPARTTPSAPARTVAAPVAPPASERVATAPSTTRTASPAAPRAPVATASRAPLNPFNRTGRVQQNARKLGGGASSAPLDDAPAYVASRPTSAPSSAEPEPPSIEETTVPETTVAETSADESTSSVAEADASVEPAPEEGPAESSVAEAPAAETPEPESTDVAPLATASPSTESTEIDVRRLSPAIEVETRGPRTVFVGRPATFRVVVRNRGQVPARDVIVTVEPPVSADLGQVRIGSGVPTPDLEKLERRISWRVPVLAAGTMAELLVDVVPRDGRRLDLAVRWTAGADETIASVDVQEPRLELSVQGPSVVEYGESRIYQLSIANPGNAPAENVVIHLLPIADGDPAPAAHALGSLPAGAKRVLDIELTARRPGDLKIRARCTADAGLESEAEAAISVRRASLGLVTAGPEFVVSGASNAYTAVVTNTGDSIARDVQVTVRLPEGGELLEATDGETDAKRLTASWSVGDLAPGASREVALRAALASGGQSAIKFEASAEQDLAETADCLVQVEAVADLVLEVSDPAGAVDLNREVAYEIRIKNRGSRAAENVEITAFFSAGLEPVGVDGGLSDLGPGQVTLRAIPVLQGGQEVVYRVKARAEAAGNRRMRVELDCKPADIRLTQEESTLFYDAQARRATSPETTRQ